ncbi:ABC transporter ATP-binding protein [Methylomonas rhizoryzae]|uniref:ABC transporter ATP-binding protein n=1 Tax=Methylomonas rhizoryzae TaxID=2608981 RepID=UPI001232D323|nr:polysaccharide ABC transporter ATP-binding protein [Methylomonas rhizoryzae]
MSVAIKVENLGKSYCIQHQQQSRYTYQTLAEKLTSGISRLGSRIVHPFASIETAQSREEFWALRDLNFEIEQGDRVGIIGRNGAGKSTLLKILSRITHPTTGKVVINGRVSSLLEVGTGFHPELTGRENIYLNGAILGMRKHEIQRKFDEIVEFAEVERFLDTPVKHYSSGMYVRLAFAVAAHLEPEVLIIDEVLAVGDAKFQAKCLGKMEEIGHSGRTVIFVSHNLSFIQQLCTTCILLAYGEMISQKTSNEACRDYLATLGSAKEYLEWTRKQYEHDKDAQITSIKVTNSTDTQLNVIFPNNDTFIDMCFVIAKPVSEMKITVALLDEYKNQIFGSFPEDAGLKTPDQSGEYHARVIIPGNIMFHNKSYGVKVLLWHPDTGIIDCIDNIQFTTGDIPCLANSTRGGRTGVITMKCEWNIRNTSNIKL